MTTTKRGNRWAIDLGTRQWTGRTKQAAEDDRDEWLANLFQDDDDEPIVVIYPGGMKLGFLSLDGIWKYYNIDNDRPYNRYGSSCYLSERSRKQAEFMIRRHVAQTVFAPKDPNAGIPYLAPGDRVGLANHRDWTTWQLLVNRYRAEGHSNGEAQERASRWEHNYYSEKAIGGSDADATIAAEQAIAVKP